MAREAGTRPALPGGSVESTASLPHPAGAPPGTKDFWRQEHTKFAAPHYRLEKTARLINRISGSRHLDLLDVGCGPATLGRLLHPRIRYFGIDIAVAEPASNLREADILDVPIGFDGRRFGIVVSQGVFEYLGGHQEQKLAEIAALLEEDGIFLATYTNFAHRRPYVYEAFTNIQSIERFRGSLEEHFIVHRAFPTSYNWNHGQPRRAWVRQANMRFNADLPVLGRRLGVEYFFVCSRS